MSMSVHYSSCLALQKPSVVTAQLVLLLFYRAKPREAELLVKLSTGSSALSLLTTRGAAVLWVGYFTGCMHSLTKYTNIVACGPRCPQGSFKIRC